MTSREFIDAFVKDQPGTMARFMDNEAFYLKMVALFPNDQSMNGLINHVNEKDWANAFRDAHTLKGVAGNMGFTELATTSSELTEVLRNPPYDEAKAVELFEKTDVLYKEVIDAIQKMVP